MSISNKSGKIRKAHEDLDDSFINPNKFEGDLHENCLYVQPSKVLSFLRKKIYKPPVIPFESETTYKKSYLKNNVSNPVSKKKKNVQVTGKVDYNTTSNMSYKGHFEKPVKQIFPTDHLYCGGSGDFSSTYLESYLNPGVVKTLPIKPIRGKIQYPIRMECRTTMTESFQDPGVKLLKRDVKPKCEVFVPSAKIDCWTLYRSSFNKTSFQKRESCRPKRCQVLISSKINGDSVYKSSYKPPGYCL